MKKRKMGVLQQLFGNSESEISEWTNGCNSVSCCLSTNDDGDELTTLLGKLKRCRISVTTVRNKAAETLKDAPLDDEALEPVVNGVDGGVNGVGNGVNGVIDHSAEDDVFLENPASSSSSRLHSTSSVNERNAENPLSPPLLPPPDASSDQHKHRSASQSNNQNNRRRNQNNNVNNNVVNGNVDNGASSSSSAAANGHVTHASTMKCVPILPSPTNRKPAIPLSNFLVKLESTGPLSVLSLRDTRLTLTVDIAGGKLFAVRNDTHVLDDSNVFAHEKILQVSCVY